MKHSKDMIKCLDNACNMIEIKKVIFPNKEFAPDAFSSYLDKNKYNGVSSKEDFLKKMFITCIKKMNHTCNKASNSVMIMDVLDTTPTSIQNKSPVVGLTNYLRHHALFPECQEKLFQAD